jgi:hypothetical protein
MKEFCYIIVAGIFTIIGAIIGGTIAYWSALKAIKLQEFNKAGSEFHIAFIETQRRLDENKSFDVLRTDGEGVWDILQQFIMSHERAKIRFRPYISKCNLASFDEAWQIYYSQENRNAECLSEYKPKFYHETKDPKHEGEIRKLALSRIEKLLSFAETKNT